MAAHGYWVALQTTEAGVPGSNPASLTQWKTLRTGRVTVYIVKSRGREREKKNPEKNNY